ncbi:hypothetical protein LTR85_001494 [Meristemomyces frigidus]|nr:hypothetical protein LTR85_001494 [Meristemomyces frigidus]
MSSQTEGTDGSQRPTTKEVVDRLFSSVKVIAATDCKKHRKVQLCDCPLALAALSPDDIVHCKTEYFQQTWENYLLHASHAFDYDGSQQAHHAFTATEGMTPKHFARAFLQCGGRKQMFAPAGRLQDTVIAMVEFWVMRVKQWRETYGGDAKTAKDKWVDDEYPGHRLDSMNFPRNWYTPEQYAQFKPGSTVHLMDFECGPPAHRTTVTLTPIENREECRTEEFKVSMMKIGIVAIKRCHEDCDESEEAIQENLHTMCAELSKMHWGAKDPIVPKHSGRIVDPEADNLEQIEAEQSAELAAIVRKLEKP